MTQPICDRFSAQWFRSKFEYDPETGWFSRPDKPGRILGRIDYKGYRTIPVQRYPYRAHRLAWLFVYGEWPTLQIDHINGIKDDNRIVNLRLATNSQNNAARSLTVQNTSGVKGVSWNSEERKWQAYIRVDGKNKNLGRYSDIEHAKIAYKVAAKLVHGEFANTGEQS